MDFSHPYHLDESTFILRGIRNNFIIIFYFSMNIVSANGISPHLGQFCLHMSHKKDAMLICVITPMEQAHLYCDFTAVIFFL